MMFDLDLSKAWALLAVQAESLARIADALEKLERHARPKGSIGGAK